MERSRNPTKNNVQLYNTYRIQLNVILREAKKQDIQNQLQINKTN